MGTSLSAEPLLSLAVTVTSEQRVERVLKSIVEGLAAQPGVALARIWLLPSAKLLSICHVVSVSPECLCLVASAGTPINSPGEDWCFLQGQFAKVPFNVGKVGQVAASRHPILVEDAAVKNDWIVRPDWARREEISSFAGHPLIFRDKLLGVIAVFSRHPLGQREFTWLGLFANQAAVAIANACTEEALRSSERNLAAIVNTIPTAAWTTRPDGYCDFINQVWLDYTGINAEKAQGWGWAEAIHPDDRTKLVEEWQSCLASGTPVDTEARLRRFDSSYRWFLIRGNPLRDEAGNILKWHGTCVDIEDRKRGEEALRTRELSWRQIVDNIPGLVATQGAMGEVEFLNRQTLEYFGKTTEELKNWALIDAVHSDDLPSVIEARKKSIEAGQIYEVEYRCRRADGVYRWFQVRGLPVRDAENKVTAWYLLLTDIDDRKKAEYLLAAEKQALEMIADGASLSDILNHVCTSMDLLVAPSVTTILLMDPDGKRLWHTAGPRVPREWVPVISPLPVALEAGLCGTAAFLKERIVVPDVAIGPNWPDQLRPIAIRNGIRAGWSEPILAKDRQVLGTFALYSPESRVPTDADLALIEGAGRIALIAIERQRSQEALRTALEEIRESERELRQIVDTIPGFVSTLSAAGEIEHLNRQALEYFGKTAEELKNWITSDAVHADDLPRVIEAWGQAVKTGEPYVMEFRQRRADGAYRWFQSRALPARDQQGRVNRWYMLFTDIDDRKKAEEALQSSERNLSLMISVIPTFVHVLRADGSVLYMNQAVMDYSGITLDDAQKEDYRARFFHPEDMERLREERRLAFSRPVPFENELRALGKDGKYRWFLVRYNPLLDEQGRIDRWYSAATDIEDRKKAEEARKLAEEALKDQLYKENLALRDEVERASMFDEIVGTSSPLKAVLSRIAKVAPADSTVLITGETGTGKELIARAIHRKSRRAGRAFVSVNCAAIPRDLIPSELFGHEKGAFTGATQRRLGRFELADRGTIFLDEVGELLPDTQVALLRVLQEREFERVGGGQPIHVDVRVIAATNRDLEAAVANGAFRQDLFYRLNVFPIEVPPLRARKDDLELLVGYFVQRYGVKAGKDIRSIEKKTLDLLQSYDWPGNIRELQNVVERSVILSRGDVFSVDELWLSKKSVSPAPAVKPSPLGPGTGSKSQPPSEREIIEAALAATRGRVSGPSGAAAKLGIPASTLEARIRVLKINKLQFKFH